MGNTVELQCNVVDVFEDGDIKLICGVTFSDNAQLLRFN